MKYLLDTCFISELVRPRPDAGVIDWLKAQDERNLHLSVVTMGEVQKGVCRLDDGKKRRHLQNWLDRELQRRFSGRILSVDLDTALRWGALSGSAENSGHRLPVLDALLAASALQHGMTLVTRNTSDFARVNVPLFNPWLPV